MAYESSFVFRANGFGNQQTDRMEVTEQRRKPKSSVFELRNGGIEGSVKKVKLSKCFIVEGIRNRRSMWERRDRRQGLFRILESLVPCISKTWRQLTAVPMALHFLTVAGLCGCFCSTLDVGLQSRWAQHFRNEDSQDDQAWPQHWWGRRSGGGWCRDATLGGGRRGQPNGRSRLDHIRHVHVLALFWHLFESQSPAWVWCVAPLYRNAIFCFVKACPTCCKRCPWWECCCTCSPLYPLQPIRSSILSRHKSFILFPALHFSHVFPQLLTRVGRWEVKDVNVKWQSL